MNRKRPLSLSGWFVAMIVLAPMALLAQAPQIFIDDVQANHLIRGHVQGLNPANHSQYKVVVYVKTDRWYIHPYAGQGQGASWTTLHEDGQWEIETVKRKFAANSIAALLVPINQSVPDIVPTLSGISSAARRILPLEGTQFHGRL